MKTAGNHKEIIPYGLHWLDEEDIAQVARALGSAWITQGPLIEEFERKVAQRCGARFAVAFSNGTSALHAACSAAGIGPGDEVVTTPMTFVATANAVLYQGGKPVFADIEPETLNVDPEKMAQAITPRTKALLPVHFAGLPCDMERIAQIARKAGLAVIEDACQAFGAEWRTSDGRWERVGSCSHSDMTAFSFHPVKHITTGEGGMVLTNREELRDRLRAFRHHGLVKAGGKDDPEPWRYEMRFLAYNGRISDFQCALGLSQLEKIDRFLERRWAIAQSYREAMEGTELVSQRFDPSGVRHSWHLYVVQVQSKRPEQDRREFYCALRNAGIGVNVHHLPVHLHDYYRRRFGYAPGQFPAAEAYYQRAVTLPLYPRMSDDEVSRVLETVRTEWEAISRGAAWKSRR